MFRRRDLSLTVIVVCTTLTAIHLLDALLFDDGLARVMALYPSELLRVLDGAPITAREGWAIATIWTSVLAHGGVEHLATNLLFFWLFGTLLAQIAGERWVVIALIVTSVTAAAAFVWRHADAAGPTGVLGASGAISGISGLYVLLSFRWDAPDVHAWPLSRPVPPVQAALAALIAAAIDVYVLRSGDSEGVAVDAHVGGFAGGLLLGAVLTTMCPTLESFRRSFLGPSDAGGA